MVSTHVLYMADALTSQIPTNQVIRVSIINDHSFITAIMYLGFAIELK